MAIRAFPELHDTHLVAIEFLPGASIRLEFRSAGIRRQLVLAGVVNFFCCGMLEGNIVDSVEFLGPDDVTSDDVAYFVEREGRRQSVERLHQRLKEARLSFLLLSPSYGAELGCVCSEVKFDGLEADSG
jgi:hypothetical protein